MNNKKDSEKVGGTHNKKIRGDFGEAAVCTYFEKRGYAVVKRNYRKRVGEVDIIATLGESVVFVEVKTRKFGSLTDGIDSVTRTKRRRIVKTAKLFLDENPQYNVMDVRFDAAQVVVTTDEIPQLIELDYYEDAFNSMLL
ncbi:MAG: YraN family protein [Oscillospiraceae bacterium]|nr:YraN family protein [Oscillospiraceae bacterium]